MVNSGALEWCTVPAPLMATVLLIYLHTRECHKCRKGHTGQPSHDGDRTT